LHTDNNNDRKAQEDIISDNAKKNKIMVLDDDLDIAELVKMSLQRDGFENVFVFTHPSLALEDFRKNYNDYSLVISDIRMPGMNGYEFVRYISRIKRDIKVIFLSAFDVNNNDILVMNAKYNSNISQIIQKPVSPKKLGKIVSSNLK
jgi:two-component SAPR family response regulator